MTKKITEFEETLMWMSYRYAISRKSRASVSLANDIAVNFFKRLPNERKEFTAFDIARELSDILRHRFGLWIYNANDNKNFQPVEILIKFLKEYNIRNLDELNKFKSISYYCKDSYYPNEKDKFFVKYIDSYVDAYHSSPDGSEQKEIYDIKVNYYPSDIEDLLHWQKLSACFDVSNLKIVTTLYNGKTEDRICFKSYFLEYGRKMTKDLQGNDYEINDSENIQWIEHWISIDTYIKGHESTYIADEYITNVRNITEEEINKLDCR